MIIDDKLMTQLEDISCLRFSVDEKGRFKGELQEMLSSMAKMTELNTDGIPECVTPLDKVNVFRDDEARPSCDRELILKNAPNRNDEMFIAPKTVE